MTNTAWRTLVLMGMWANPYASWTAWEVSQRLAGVTQLAARRALRLAERHGFVSGADRFYRLTKTGADASRHLTADQ